MKKVKDVKSKSSSMHFEIYFFENESCVSTSVSFFGSKDNAIEVANNYTSLSQACSVYCILNEKNKMIATNIDYAVSSDMDPMDVIKEHIEKMRNILIVLQNLADSFPDKNTLLFLELHHHIEHFRSLYHSFRE